ncbi:hypothetical protein ACU686_16010 [Yinghuangia aomiensis]
MAADYARVPGPDHPTTLTGRHNHARQLGESRDHAAAARLFAAVAADHARVLGPDHPDTFVSRQPRMEPGRPGARRGDGPARRLGRGPCPGPGPRPPRHTRELPQPRMEPGGGRGVRGCGAAAHADLAADRARVLGPDHDATLASRNNHAHCLAKSGQHAGLRRRCSPTWPRIAPASGPRPPQHPQRTPQARDAAGESGQQPRRRRSCSFRWRRTVPGSWAPTTLTLASRHSHAWHLGESGEHTAAAVLFRVELATDYARVSGAPTTLDVRRHARPQ